MPPPIKELNEMSELVSGLSFDSLTPDQRVKIINLVQADQINSNLIAIADNTDTIAHWFDNSKIYWP